MHAKHVCEQQLESQLRVTDAQISQLTAKLKNAREDVKFMYALQLDDIKSSQRKLTLNTKALDKRPVDSWEKIKITLKHFSHELRTDADQATDKFKHNTLKTIEQELFIISPGSQPYSRSTQ